MSGLYVDSSAILKRLFAEAESDEVRGLLGDRIGEGIVVVSSELAWVEVSRALRRAGIDDVSSATDLAFSGVAQHPLSPDVLHRARRIGPQVLRTLDAIHLAAAVDVEASEVLTYDARLAAAAESVGLRALP